MSNQNFKHQGGEPLNDLERLKKEAGFIDFSTINALRIASRIFVSYGKDGKTIKKGLALCVEKRKQPYALIGHFIANLYISPTAKEANDFALLEEKPIRPNYTIFNTLREFMCGTWKERYQNGFPPFIAKVQAVAPIMGEVRSALKKAKDLGLYPWLLQYNGANPKILSEYKMFEIGSLLNEKPIQELPEYEKLKKFKELLTKFGLKHKNGVIAITPEDFDKAYEEAFAEEIATWHLARQKSEENQKPTFIEDEEFSKEENSEIPEDLDIDF